MHEIKLNLHIHTRYSDGTGTHLSVGQAALQSGLDALIVTDHNVLVQGVDTYIRSGRQRTLLLVGEEIHDPAQTRQKNHLLVFSCPEELSPLAANPQQVIDRANSHGALTFIAHPFEDALPAFHEPAINWENWEVRGYTGIELWNGLSEFKSASPSTLHVILNALFPHRYPAGPLPQTMEKWDELTSAGQKVVGIAGSDAHALRGKFGPLRRTIFPYTYHFTSVNNHLLLPERLSGEFETDKRMIYSALASGNLFIGYDRAAPTSGFRFTVQGLFGMARMGDTANLQGSATLQIRLPQRAECRLLKDGQLLRSWDQQEFCTLTVSEPGVYRVEAYLNYLGRRRTWIISNPIYLLPKPAANVGQ